MIRLEDMNMEISRNVVENMMMTYVDHKKMMIEYEKELEENDGEYDFEDNAEYMFHKGCCETTESWLRAIGVSPQCNFITENLYG